MVVFIGSGLLIGSLLGTRLTVLAVIPAALLALCIAAFTWAAGAPGIDWNLYHVIALLVFLQIGYVGGAGLSFLTAARRVAKPRGLAGAGDVLTSRSWDGPARH